MPIAAMVCGIVGLVFSFVPCLGMYAIPVTLVAVILGVLGMKKEKGKGMAIAGLITGIVGTLIAGYWIYVYFTVKGDLEKFDKDLKSGKFDKEIKDTMEKEMKKELDKATQPSN
jgi:hypothetical protein